MLSRFRFIAALLLVSLLSTPPHAARDLETAALPDTGVELVIVEAEGCIYCAIFRRDVLPAYESSPRARTVPIRFLDVNDAEDNRYTLDGPVDLVPTALVVRDKKEVGRIAGYIGPEAFFHSINRLLGGIEME